MSKKPPQFLHGSAGKSLHGSPRTDRAIYRLGRNDKNGKPITIAVECVEGGGNVPRNAASLRGLTRDIQLDLDAEFESVVAIADSVLNALKALRPGEVEIEFGIEMGGELGIPLVTRGEAKANFKVTMTWKNAGEPE